ncbi:MAG: hypothetical protein KKE02_20810 [Alphaproteobacteria bacterium]|nr:hypothetical protein [Alphaproteobacteria bacterium]MBU1514524.1 hypothetical protein [Alphaproteobacteria bacterium]MBU2096844.1 hypothetical protein [Alphaproteobacteria bacterium]MBU2153471.1 hypothetical protein [Alphaproteobacteria bacterium]MBU2306024.1 hypothetical protein [Alphaproteobacteria bacterium]
MRKFLLPLAAVSALLAAAPAVAHDELEVAGQVTAVTAKTIQLRTKEGKLVTLEVDGNTRVVLAGKRVTPATVKVGQSVKALGFGDSLADLVAIDVTINPPAAGKK